jgi:hypothetical protein
MNGARFRVKRCLVFGYFLPMNLKEADAGMRQRLLVEVPSLGPEIKRRPAPSAGGRKAEIHWYQFDAVVGRRMIGAVSLIRTSSDGGRSSSLCPVGMPSEKVFASFGSIQSSA